MSAILGAPWRWDAGWGEVEDATGRTVASVSAEYEPAGPALAAVPELVAALEEMLGPDTPHAPRRTLAEGEAIRNRARAALAKAKPTTPPGKIVYPPAIPQGAGPDHAHDWQPSEIEGVLICATCGDDCDAAAKGEG